MAGNSTDRTISLHEKPSKTHRIQRIRDVNAGRLGDFPVTVHIANLVNTSQIRDAVDLQRYMTKVHGVDWNQIHNGHS
jgi:hypothetical protein